MNELKRKLKTLAWIVFFWIAYALLLFTYDFLQKGLPSQDIILVKGEYHFIGNLVGYLSGGLIASLVLGIFELFIINELFKRRSILTILIIKSLFFLIVYFIIAVMVSFFYNMSELNKPLFDPVVVSEVQGYIFSGQNAGNFLLWGLVAAATFYLIQINYIFGPGTLIRFLAGNFQKPKVVERIFMFLDISDSTAIAEKLGHQKFFEFIQDFMFDISNPILSHSGEIYKYVGDEIIISWSLQSGLDNNNCIKVFYAIQETIKDARKNYQNKFDLIPKFSAGAHAGSVMVGELGRIKKEIAYSGDVLNTTARIQSECKKHSESFIISETLFNQLGSKIKTNDLGNILLKGKAEKLRLLAVKKY